MVNTRDVVAHVFSHFMLSRGYRKMSTNVIECNFAPPLLRIYI